ncbi:MAG: hypothetical protein B7Z12_11920 [Caulobacter vibrioides]|uniref:Uncharacterized protein n=1 Tax=Caulobacter vibrioides TaxID=155892 RepID=A0A258D411_CAUVI|nr:MAG: hypothetical protein B7Z12_11920 [Caulobacter vibrioides]
MSDTAIAPKRRFFFATAVIMAAIVVLSFPLTYYAPLVTGSKRFDLLHHVHGFAFFAWMGLYVWQTWLASRGRIAFHREIGLAGLVLAGAMIPLGYWMAQRAAELRIAAGTSDPYYGTWFNLTDLTLFAMLMLASVAMVTRKREWHRRLTYVATLCLVAPAATRWTLKFPLLAPLPLDIFSYLVMDPFLIALALYDRKATGRFHPATVLCVAMLLPLQISAAWIARSEWWSALAPTLIGPR